MTMAGERRELNTADRDTVDMIVVVRGYKSQDRSVGHDVSIQHAVMQGSWSCHKQ